MVAPSCAPAGAAIPAMASVSAPKRARRRRPGKPASYDFVMPILSPERSFAGRFVRSFVGVEGKSPARQTKRELGNVRWWRYQDSNAAQTEHKEKLTMRRAKSHFTTIP